MQTTDILIVGGGPAGSTLARRVASAGREVTLIERACFPRHKPCGGGLSGHAIAALELDISEVVECDVEQLVVAGGWTGRLEVPVEKRCQVVERKTFDHFLLRQAETSGATILEGCGLTDIQSSPTGFRVTTNRGRIETRILCACDGATSRTARALGLAPTSPPSIALEAIAHPATRVTADAIFDFTAIPGGYGWLFPRRDCWALGVATAHAIAPQLRNHLMRMIGRLPESRDAEIGEIRGGLLPVFHAPREVYARDNAYLLGDAAGLVDKFSGEGLQYAILSANLAAAAILGDGCRQYEAAIRHQILPELELAARWANMVCKIPPAAFGAIMTTPVYRYYLRHLAEIFIGVTSYRQVLADAAGARTMLRWFGKPSAR